MFGYKYALKQNFSFTAQELRQMFTTSFVFAFILTALFKGFLRQRIILEETLLFFAVILVFILFSMGFHISMQKAAAIRLGYKATYTYWTNGILLSLFLNFMSFGFIPFIFPGSVQIAHLPKLRLGKFRYGANLKDLGRVCVAGPLAHVFLIIIAGAVYLVVNGTKDGYLYAFIGVNMFLAFYSILPIPKLDLPTKMDAGSDGLGLFFFSRIIYFWVLAVILLYLLLIILGSIFSIVLAFLLGSIGTIVYVILLDQKN